VSAPSDPEPHAPIGSKYSQPKGRLLQPPRPRSLHPNRSYRLPTGKLLTMGFGIGVRNLVAFAFLSLLVYSPWVALELVKFDLMADMERNSANLLLLLINLLPLPLGMVVSGAIAYGVVQQLRGKRASLGDCIAHGLRDLGRILGTGAYATLRIGVGMILCFVPGLIETCRLYVAMPVAVIEGCGPRATVRRSIELTDGNRGPIFGVVLLLGLAQFLAGMAAAIGFEVAAGIQPEPLGYSLTIIAITILFGVFQSTMAAVAYSLLRKGRENVDIEELEAVFA
jgi:hypothetical protein